MLTAQSTNTSYTQRVPRSGGDALGTRAAEEHGPENEAPKQSPSAQRWRRIAAVLASDVLMLGLCGGGGLLSLQFFMEVQPAHAWILGAAAVLCIAVHAIAGRYATAPRQPVRDLRVLSIGTTLAFALVGTATALLAPEWAALEGLPIAWMLALPAVPIGRSFVRSQWSSRPWWGHPTVVVGAGSSGADLAAALQRHPELGLSPCVLIGECSNAPVPAGATHAAVDLKSVSEEGLIHLMRHDLRHFERVLFFPDESFYAHLPPSSVDTRALTLDGRLSLEVQNRLFTPWRRRLKRTLDVAVAALGLVLLLPLGLVIALLIKRGSEGPVFYTQERLGEDGHRFHIYKFRSMYRDADARLREYLQHNPEARQRLKRYRKLPPGEDPRVTPIGHVLRKFSLDELPQLINVLRGEMSLIGPRPYLPSEKTRMQEKAHTILRARPGVTGLWQVRGRNNLTFEQRLEIDENYVHNWSVSLDCYLLARTVPVVVTGHGAS